MPSRSRGGGGGRGSGWSSGGWAFSSRWSRGSGSSPSSSSAAPNYTAKSATSKDFQNPLRYPIRPYYTFEVLKDIVSAIAGIEVKPALEKPRLGGHNLLMRI
ncbi:hypothetical protein IQ07DRAFT_24364 [Pyrenochaeta sp. DS3sAY3a]|nr:hypothetical protein IQ07DRAFT_24364 [Pyrenochaeta sp. DS3sAY3a]